MESSEKFPHSQKNSNPSIITHLEKSIQGIKDNYLTLLKWYIVIIFLSEPQQSKSHKVLIINYQKSVNTISCSALNNFYLHVKMTVCQSTDLIEYPTFTF